jgi:SAM-dependent methyltransferase
MTILECGSGNGTLLLSFLLSPEDSTPQTFHLTGIDYSPKAATLAAGIESHRREHLEEIAVEEDEVINDVPPVSWRTGDLLRDEIDEQWDLVLDKGTFDALCLSDERIEEDSEKRLPSAVYPERISRLVKPDGFFLITSCNFTEDEIKRRWTREGSGEFPMESISEADKADSWQASLSSENPEPHKDARS